MGASSFLTISENLQASNITNEQPSVRTFLSAKSNPKLLTKFRTGLNMKKAKGPNAELLRELALEDRELLKMLSSNGRYKPDSRSSTD